MSRQKGRIDLSELFDHVSERKPNERASACDWGNVAALVYAASFLTTGQRIAIRLVAQKCQSVDYDERRSIADDLHDISRVASELAEDWDSLAEDVRKRGH